MATVDEALAAVVESTNEISTYISNIAADIEVIKNGTQDPAQSAKLDEIVTRSRAAASALKALDEQNPTIPIPLP